MNRSVEEEGPLISGFIRGGVFALPFVIAYSLLGNHTKSAFIICVLIDGLIALFWIPPKGWRANLFFLVYLSLMIIVRLLLP
jgi:hypothetical protein